MLHAHVKTPPAPPRSSKREPTSAPLVAPEASLFQHGPLGGIRCATTMQQQMLASFSSTSPFRGSVPLLLRSDRLRSIVLQPGQNILSSTEHKPSMNLKCSPIIVSADYAQHLWPPRGRYVHPLPLPPELCLKEPIGGGVVAVPCPNPIPLWFRTLPEAQASTSVSTLSSAGSARSGSITIGSRSDGPVRSTASLVSFFHSPDEDVGPHAALGESSMDAIARCGQVWLLKKNKEIENNTSITSHFYKLVHAFTVDEHHDYFRSSDFSPSPRVWHQPPTWTSLMSLP